MLECTTYVSNVGRKPAQSQASGPEQLPLAHHQMPLEV
jgi:hypothetical protein